MKELNRLIRHGVAPFVMWLVASGYLPEYMQGDVTEGLVVAVSIIVPLIISKLRENVKDPA